MPGESSPLSNSNGYIRVALALTNSEHLGATYRTCTLICWFAVFHSYGLGILHFPFCTALYTICFHIHASSRSFALTLTHLTHPGQAGSRCFRNKKRGAVLPLPYIGLLSLGSQSVLKGHTTTSPSDFGQYYSFPT